MSIVIRQLTPSDAAALVALRRRALLDAVIEHARTLAGVEWVRLSVSENTPDARRVYERAGFEVRGVEPDALRHEGRSARECRLTLRLERRPGDERLAPRS